MAGYGYTNQGYTDDWNRRSNNGENGWYLDAEGRRRPTISYPPNQSSESYYATNHRYGSPTRVEPIKEYIIIAQPEANRLTRPGSTGYGEYTNFNNDWNKPNGYTIQDEYYRRNDTEPAMKHHQSGWERPGHKGHSHETTHTGPTNEIGKAAVEILKEVAVSSMVTSAAPQPRFTLPASMVQKRDTQGRIIDNKAIGRYGSINLSSRSY